MITKEKLVIIFLLFIFISCKESSVAPESSAKIFQLPDCRPSINKKSSDILIDSCFTYTFNERLIIDFCVSGNCCSDENRFLIKNSIFKDTITVTIADTAANLCRCICNYIIHGEFESLPYDSYTIICKDFSNSVVFYTKRVIKNKWNIK